MTPLDRQTKVPHRVALFNPIIAHYRAGLIKALNSTTHCEFFWFADSKDAVDAIPSLDLSGHPRFRRSKNHSLGGLRWQSGTVSASFGSYDTYIFLGSANWLSSWVAALIARARGKRVLMWTHGWLRRDPFLKRVIRNSLYRLAHGLLLYGERARTLGIEQGFAPERLHVMYNSLDFDEQQRLRATVTPAESHRLRMQLFAEADRPVVLATARLTAVKQFDHLIRSIGRLAVRGKRVNLLIVGDGPQKSTLQALAVSEGIDATFTGACYDEKQLATYYAIANVTVSPGNVGLTCMHSLGYGVPVITHDNPDDQMPEWEAVVSGVNGFLFKQHSIDDLSDAIDDWTQTSSLNAVTREICLTMLKTKYHPAVQGRLIVDAVLNDKAARSQTQLEAESAGT